MSYINREKAVENVSNIRLEVLSTRAVGKSLFLEAINLYHDTVLKTLREAPTADVKELRHGEWESFEIPHMMRCSECGVSDLDIHRTKFTFCPYCGAKMDGERSENGKS